MNYEDTSLIIFVLVFIIMSIIAFHASLEGNRIYESCKLAIHPEESPKSEKTFDHCRVYPQTYNITKFKWIWEQ